MHKGLNEELAGPHEMCTGKLKIHAKDKGIKIFCRRLREFTSSKGFVGNIRLRSFMPN